VLRARGLSVASFGDLRTAGEALALRSFDAWVLGRCGEDEHEDATLALIHARRRAGETAPILVVSRAHDRRRASHYHRLGASGVFEPLTNDTLSLFAARATLESDREMERLVEAVSVERALTQREAELAMLVGRGVARRAIASALSTLESTAKALVRSLLSKTGHPSLEALARSMLETSLRRAASPLARAFTSDNTFQER
jgi:DNA-binding NarL/FixJ family response regulator